MKTTTRRRILLVYTGGTIGMKRDPAGVLVPFDFNAVYDEFPYLRKLDVDIELASFAPIDSSNVTPELWVALAELGRERHAQMDGFVILHGTDTMSYTASALSFMLEGLEKPVVLTGSQLPIGVLRTDGRENLITAVEIASAYEAGRAVVPEVCLYFQNKLLRGNRSTKFSAESLDAFRSENYPPLAEVGVNIQYNNKYINSFADQAGLTVSTRLDTSVSVVRIFPGMSEEVLRGMLSIPGVRGVVFQSYGTGNAPTADWFLDALREAIDRGVVIVNVTQCPGGNVSMELYQTGASMARAGVVSGRDMTVEAAVTKLMCILGRGLCGEELRSAAGSPLRGEMSE
jgi:L-asparaginase